MNRKDRMELIEKIQEERKSKLVVYITGDRRGLETKISADVFPMFHKHLTQIGEQERIDLFLYSTGGTTIDGYALVDLFREFCKKFNVIIPFKALSCATLITLGADEVVMTKMGQLSPIDPSVGHPLGPIVQIPGQPRGRIAPVNVEDVNAFIELAKKEIGLSEEDSMKKILEILASKVNPLVLGAVQRSREQIAFLASMLMKYHTKDEEKIKNTVEILTRQRFSHDYIISRREAKEVLELNIIEPDDELTNLIIDLFNAYNDILMMDKPYNPEVALGTDEVKITDFNRAIIESINLTHIFRTKKEIRRIQVTQPGIPHPVIGYQERILQDEWMEDNTL
jgi:hypothetical protein